MNGHGRPSKGRKRSRGKYQKTEPKLTKAEWKQIHKFEDALKDEEGKLFYTDSWAVKFTDQAEVEVADRIAAKHGFANLGKVGTLAGYYHFKHIGNAFRGKRSTHEKTKLLMSEDEVLWAERQHVLNRNKRDGVPSDPKFQDQWYLFNQGQSSGPAGVDVNVVPVWRSGITGRGVVVSILDDGVDSTHPDLHDNFDQKASYDFNDMDADPHPRDTDPDNCHGTRCAGEVAAKANNSICGVGVAYNANIGGVRMLDGQATDVLEGSALSFQSNYIDVYSNCWGPKDDGKTFGKPGKLAQEALKEGALKGRDGKGNIYVWATGNGGLTDDDCNCDGYTTSIFTISVGCIGDHGLSAYYTELCSSTLAVTFNGGSHREKEENKIVTTDLHHRCTEEFKGTSSAAPLAAGMIALALEANPNLTWRDVQHVIVESAQVTSPVDEGWISNGAGYHFNHKFGFGRMDAYQLVQKAKSWKNVAPQRVCKGPSSETQQEIPAGGTLSVTIDTIACADTKDDIEKLEHVTLTMSFQHRRRGQVSIDLFSPSGTRNEMLSTRRYDDSRNGLHDWTFMTVHNWGENPKGVWIMNVTDNINILGKHLNAGTFIQHDTSKQAADVEDLEQEVIDDQKKTEELERVHDGTGTPRPVQDNARYPEGVKKFTIDRGMPRTEDRKYFTGGYVTQPTFWNRSNSAYYNDFNYGRPMTYGYVDQPYTSEYQYDEDPRGRRYVKRDTMFDSIYPDDDRENFVTSSESKREQTYIDAHPQETLEETGSQRVQVNNGFQEDFVPGFNSESGHVTSGILLQWKLTFYGTGSQAPDDDDTL
ncbi:PC3-like endoprotease variant B [Dendronephthya gigantea]|uniref:PC3-like endoprotease variant B n=1 Tax=Dendronephthya gigantea TaxID=151771 RepID=UPI00106A9877|nr:PC3-like endoprotease variant B [Dendronephthya gigantea]